MSVALLLHEAEMESDRVSWAWPPETGPQPNRHPAVPYLAQVRRHRLPAPAPATRRHGLHAHALPLALAIPQMRGRDSVQVWCPAPADSVPSHRPSTARPPPLSGLALRPCRPSRCPPCGSAAAGRPSSRSGLLGGSSSLLRRCLPALASS
jgi:hypothetical protein